MLVSDSQTFHVIRWRFFVNNCWLALSAGITIYVGTLLLGYPYGWLALLYVVKYALWSLKDMTNLRVVVKPNGIEGPGFTFTSVPRYIAIDEMDPKHSGIRGGRFFIRGKNETLITSRLFWYHPSEQSEIRALIAKVNPQVYLNFWDVQT